MRRRRRKIRHMRAKIYAVDACMLALAISTTGLINADTKAADEAQNTFVTLSKEVQAQTPENAARGCIEPIQGIMLSYDEDNSDTLIKSRDWGIEDSEILQKIAMAEAEGESVEGKALVMLVVLNRVWSDEFPGTVEDVVFQEGQFEPVEDGGRYWTTEPDEDCQKAEEMILHGWDESNGALYFASTNSPHEWHENNLEYLFTVGNQDFYR